VDGSAGFESVLIGNPQTWFLVESSNDLFSWVPLTTLRLDFQPAPLLDSAWSDFARRFYRASETVVAAISQFDSHASGTTVMFQNPSYSGTTDDFIETSETLPNF